MPKNCTIPEIIFPIGPSIAYIQASKGTLVLIDADDAETLSPFRWYSGKIGKTIYSASRMNGHTVYMHRFILGHEVYGKLVDHKNLNGLDNRRDNIRPATKSQNSANTAVPENNTSGYKGVYLDKSRGSYAAEVKVNKKKIYVGRFSSLEEAARARDLKHKEIFGEFGRDK